MKIDKTCPKCGYDDTNLTYMKYGATPKSDKDYQALLTAGLAPEYSRFYHAHTNSECMLLHCRTCQYTWAMKLPIEPEPQNAFGLSEEDIEKLRSDLNDSIPKPGIVDFPCDLVTEVYKSGGKVNDGLSPWQTYMANAWGRI